MKLSKIIIKLLLKLIKNQLEIKDNLKYLVESQELLVKIETERLTKGETK